MPKCLMMVIDEISLRNFEFWSGALDNVRELTLEELDELEDILVECYPEGMSATQINDIMWFDFDWVCEVLGKDNGEDE